MRCLTALDTLLRETARVPGISDSRCGERDDSSKSATCGPSENTTTFRCAAIVLALIGASCEQAESQRSAQTPARKASTGRLSFNNLTVPRNEIRVGGPPKDGIPAITDPDITAADTATFLSPQSRVIGATIGKQSRAWPIAVLNYHEIIHDRLGGIPIAMTYCPLCDSAAIFDRRTKDGVREFGVSGLLYNSNVLMTDCAGSRASKTQSDVCPLHILHQTGDLRVRNLTSLRHPGR